MKRLITLLAVALTLTLSGAAFAQNENKARDLFGAGVAAYEDGQFLHAAQAFLEAHRLIQKPQLLFSAAQAFRRQYDADGDQKHLALAIQHYSDYLAVVKEGGRRVDAARALGELRPLLREGEGAAQMRFDTRVSITAGVKGAVVSIDGGPWLAVPYAGEIEPGPHKVVVRASGYVEATRDFVAEEGRVAPVDVPLRGMPPTLEILGADGAEITVDGKRVGEAPLAGSLDVEPGSHFVSVTRTGHKPYSAELDFAYGAETEVTLDLPATNQRRVAWGVLAAGAGTLVAAGVLTGLAFVEQGAAKDIEEAQAAGVITEVQRLSHNDAIEARDDLRLAAFVAAGAGAAVTITGLFLYLFDEPVVTPPMRQSDGEPEEKTPEKQPEDVEMMGAPILSPSEVGFSIVGRF